MSVSFNSSRLSYPPLNTQNCVAIVLEGVIENDNLFSEKRIKECANVIAVQTGIDYCLAKNIESKVRKIVVAPHKLDPRNLNANFANGTVPFLLTKQKKDYTDLEFAIRKANAYYQNPQIMVYGGLNGGLDNRIDRTINNLFLLLRDPGKVFLDSKNEMVFSINSEMKTIHIDVTGYNTVGFFPINGAARNLKVTQYGQDTDYPLIENEVQLYHTQPHSNEITLTLGTGELIVCLDKRHSSTSGLLHRVFRPSTDLVGTELIKVVDYLFKLSTGHLDKIKTENETIFCLKASQKTYEVDCEQGQIISLFPFSGPANRVTTNGLLWELANIKENLNRDYLNKDFVGQSNVSRLRGFTIRIEQGQALCFMSKHRNMDILNKNGSAEVLKKQNNDKEERKEGSPSFASTSSNRSMDDLNLTPPDGTPPQGNFLSQIPKITNLTRTHSID